MGAKSPIDLCTTLQLAELNSMLVAGVLDVRDPHVDQAWGLARKSQGSLDSSTVVVTTDNDMLDLQGGDSIFQASHAVHVLVGGEVAHITLHEDLSRCETQKGVGLQEGY